MEKYEIKISYSAEKSLKKIPKKEISKIIDKILELSIDPFPNGHKKIHGENDTYRIRHGNYRIIYEFQKKILLILILKIGHRKDIYR